MRTLIIIWLLVWAVVLGTLPFYPIFSAIFLAAVIVLTAAIFAWKATE